MISRKLEFKVAEQVWPLDKPFRIARGIRTEARVVVVTVNDGDHAGHAEAVPCKRYGQTVESTMAQLEQIFPRMETSGNRQQLQELLCAG
ncbi:MAG: L-Ala-D/L-Glu epimerase, partial [Verrucomicrobiota bacterium]